MSTNPRPLPLEFNRHGHTYKQLERNDRAAIYSVSGAGFELVRIRTAKESKLPGGAIAPFREVYPSDEEFGVHGWYFMPDEEAKMRQRFNELTHGPAA